MPWREKLTTDPPYLLTAAERSRPARAHDTRRKQTQPSCSSDRVSGQAPPRGARCARRSAQFRDVPCSFGTCSSTPALPLAPPRLPRPEVPSYACEPAPRRRRRRASRPLPIPITEKGSRPPERRAAAARASSPGRDTPHAPQGGDDLIELERQLAAAVQLEDFAKAARLRDLIKRVAARASPAPAVTPLA